MALSIKYTQYLVLVFLILFSSCSYKHNRRIETIVLNDIFNQLVYEMDISNQTINPPDNLGNQFNKDTVNYDVKTDNLEVKNISNVKSIVAIYDTLFSCYRLNLDLLDIETQLSSENYKDILQELNDSSVINKPIRLLTTDLKENIKLKYLSEFPKNYNIWKKENYNFPFLGILKISRIYFDKKKQFGLFYCSFACGRLCGEEAIICIKMINKTWSIDQIITLSVS